MKKIIVIVFLCFTGWEAMAGSNGNQGSRVENLGRGMKKVTWFYDNGQVAEEGFYLGAKKTGTWTSFDEKGNKLAVMTWNQDRKDGNCYVMHKNGKVKYHVVYSNNKKVMTYEWDESGTLLGNQK